MALLELFTSDRATTTVSSGGTDAPSSGTTETWTVASSAMFGTASTGVSQFHVSDPSAPSEMIAVTNVSGTTWTVTRGAESTTPVTHEAGFTIYQVATAGWLGGLAQLVSPALTGTPTAPTATPLTDGTQIASTAYADAAVAVETSRAETAEASLAPKASPALTGTPTAPTAAPLTDDTQLATTGYADAAVAVETGRAETAEALKAPLASPALTGTPTAPTQTTGDSSTKIATDSFVATAVAAETTRAETAEALKLPLAGGTMSGPIAMGSNKVTGLASGSASSDAAAYGQVLPAAGGTMTGNLELAAGTTTVPPLTFQSGTNLTSAAAGDAEFDGTCFYGTAAASSRQVLDAEQFQILTSTYTLTSNTSPQALLNATTAGAVTVQALTGYFFECLIYITSLSGSSHQVAFSFGGSATPSVILYIAVTDTTSGGTAASVVGTTASAVNLVAATSNGSLISTIRGSVRFGSSDGGTFTPEITQVTASAAAVVNIGTYFRLWPMGSNTVSNVGDWS